MIEDRGYVAQALFDRLRAEGMALRVLGDSRGYPESAPAEAQLAVPRGALGGMPRAIARFCQEFDLQLVELSRPEIAAWKLSLAWTDDLGRPHFLGVRVFADYWRRARRLLGAEELLAGTPDALFIHAVLDGLERQSFAGEWLCMLWEQDPRGAAERVARFWPGPAEFRLIAQAAKHGDWLALRPHLPRLRRALNRAVAPSVLALGARAALFARRLAQPAGASVRFAGGERSLVAAVSSQVARDLAPLGLDIHRAQERRRPSADLQVLIGEPAAPQEADDTVAIAGDQPLGTLAAAAERAILRWLECRVERRHPRAVVGDNPPAARLLQLAVRRKVPFLSQGMSFFLNCEVRCRIRSPILMPYPYGIVIEPGARIGSRVTIMQQASLHGAPLVEDNVCIGPGARILGPVRIGRGATVGANAVVTRDVPSHCTVVGANRVLGAEHAPVVPERREDGEAVVNT